MINEFNLQLNESADFVSPELHNGSFSIQLFYVDSLCNELKLQHNIVDPFFHCLAPESFISRINALPSCHAIQKEQVSVKLHKGFVIISVANQLFAYETKHILINQINDTKVEQIIYGPQSSLSEDTKSNLNLIRQMYPTENLHIEMMSLGTLSETDIKLLYDKVLVNDQALQDIKKRLQQVNVKMLQSASQLSKLISAKKWEIFPTILITQRTDRIAHSLSEGKIVILVQGTPFALIAPVIFHDFMASMSDKYDSALFASFITTFRYIAAFIALTLPAIYVAYVSYNPGISRVTFTLSVSGSRAVVPYPSFVEVIIMLGMIEALLEASIRVPKVVGPAVTTVGGLILGQAVQQAGLVSSIMIIVTSVVAISNFVVPNTQLGNAIRIFKYIILIFSVFYGMIGISVAIFCLIFYLTDLRSYGVSYLKLPILSKKKGA